MSCSHFRLRSHFNCKYSVHGKNDDEENCFDSKSLKRHEDDKHWYFWIWHVPINMFNSCLALVHQMYMYCRCRCCCNHSQSYIYATSSIIDWRVFFSISFSHDCYTNDSIFVIERHERHQNNINSFLNDFRPNHHLILIIITFSDLLRLCMCVSKRAYSVFFRLLAPHPRNIWILIKFHSEIYIRILSSSDTMLTYTSFYHIYQDNNQIYWT